MPFNGSEIISEPWNTTFSPFTDLFGSGFWLIPLTFVAVALYVKTRSLPAVFVFLLASCSLRSAGDIFLGFPEMAFVYFIFSILAIVGLALSVYFEKIQR